jgi:hypothetical protein
MLRDDCALNLWRIQIAPKPQACPRYHRFPKVAWSRPRPLRGSFERLVDANKIIIQEMQLCLLKTSSAAEILVRYRMRRITIKRARTWHYRKMRPCIEQSNGLASLSPFPSWPDRIISTSGYDFRKGQRSRTDRMILKIIAFLAAAIPIFLFVRSIFFDERRGSTKALGNSRSRPT